MNNPFDQGLLHPKVRIAARVLSGYLEGGYVTDWRVEGRPITFKVPPGWEYWGVVQWPYLPTDEPFPYGLDVESPD